MSGYYRIGLAASISVLVGCAEFTPRTGAACDECIVLERIVLIEERSGPDFIEETRAVVGDDVGRFWVGQRDYMALYDSMGNRVASVGRPGQGPGEFMSARPFAVDTHGRIHILDTRNARVTVVGPDREVEAMHRVPGSGIFAIAVLPEPGAYVVNAWVPSAESLGHPIHLVSGGVITNSIGAPVESGIIDPFNSLRHVAVDREGSVYTVSRFDRQVEVWTPSGELTRRFSGPELNAAPVQQAPYNFSDNPVPNEIVGIQVDDDGRVWLLGWRVRDGWERHYEEVHYPDGGIGLNRLNTSGPDSIYGSWIEVYDPAENSLIARVDRDELFSAFAGPGRLLENLWDEDGTPRLAVWRAKLLVGER